MLEEKSHLPAVLQSLGCIAQAAMSVFETRESEVEKFIKENILKQDQVYLPNSVLKIYGHDNMIRHSLLKSLYFLFVPAGTFLSFKIPGVETPFCSDVYQVF